MNNTTVFLCDITGIISCTDDTNKTIRKMNVLSIISSLKKLKGINSSSFLIFFNYK